MGDFFKPWRTKIGILTLLIALGFMAGGFWSRFYLHTLEIPFGNRSIDLTSQGGTLTASYSFPQRETSTQIATSVYYNSFPINRGKGPVYDGSGMTPRTEVYLQYQFGLFGFSSTRFDDCYAYSCGAPYWSFALLLSLLSAYLLLTKPRTSKPNAVVGE